MSNSEVTLPNGAKLVIQLAPFGDAKALFQAVMAEMKGISVASVEDVGGLMKDLFCTTFSSPKIESCLEKCLARCLIDNRKIDSSTFESEEARENYVLIYTEVLKANLAPFTKSLFAELNRFSTMIGATQA